MLSDKTFVSLLALFFCVIMRRKEKFEGTVAFLGKRSRPWPFLLANAYLTLENLFRGRPDDEQGEKRANFEKATSLALADLRSLRNNADLVGCCFFQKSSTWFLQRGVRVEERAAATQFSRLSHAWKQ